MATLFILAWGITTPPAHAFDDAYITYRYAENWRNGLGLVYNPGEPVLGTTAPLFAILLGAFGFFFGNIETLGHWFGILGWIAMVWVSGILLWETKRPFAALLAMLFVALQPELLNSLGMETPLVIALMLASAWFWLYNKKLFLAALTMAALLLVRLDGTLWALVIGLETWRRNGRFPWRQTAFTLLLTLPWFIYAQWQYGSVLPNSAAAKIGQTSLMPVGGQWSFLYGYWATWAWMPWVALAAFSIVLGIGIWVIIRYDRNLWWLPAWTVFYLAVYVGLHVANFPWYYTSPIVLTTLVAAIGGGHLLGDGRENVYAATPLNSSRLMKTVLTAILLIMLIPAWFNQLKTIQERSGYHAAYRPIGHWLQKHTLESDRVASIEIGVIGYLSQRPILDTMGLVSLEMTRHQVGWQETLAYAVTQFWPEYAVVLEDTAWDWVINQWWFTEFYAPVAYFDGAAIYYLQQQPKVPYQIQTTVDYVPGFSLIGAELSGQELIPGDWLDVWVHVDVQKGQSADYQLTAYLIDTQTDERTAVTTVNPLNGGYNASVWQPGDQLTLPIRLLLPSDLSSGTYQLGLFIYNPQQKAGISLAAAPDIYPETRLGWFRIGSPVIADTTDLKPEPIQALWSQGIALETLFLPQEPRKPGDILPVGLQWYVNQSPVRNLKVFVHFINQEGDILAQVDQRPFNGRFPTTSWRPDERLTDVINIQLPADLSPGAYGLRIGLYDENGRLPLSNGEDFIQHNSRLIVRQ